MPNDYYCFIIMALLSRIISITDDILKGIKWSGICTSLLINRRSCVNTRVDPEQDIKFNESNHDTKTDNLKHL